MTGTGDGSEEDIIARTPTMRQESEAYLVEIAMRQGMRGGLQHAANVIWRRAAEIEAEGSASIFAGAIVSELRSQAKKLRDMYVKEGE